MARVCTNIESFDMTKYLKANIQLSIVSYLWQPCAASPVRLDRYFPTRQSAAQIKRLKAINAWADRTDPGSLIRNAYTKWLWDSRQPGGVIVPVK